jgi:hypothetical protein
MMLNWITSDGVSNHALAELPDLRKRTDGFLWLDIPEWRDEAEEILTNEYRQSVKHLRGWDPWPSNCGSRRASGRPSPR